MEKEIEGIRVKCWNKALDSFGYSYIYAKRIQKLDKALSVTKVVGVLIPVLLGALLGGYYDKPEVIKTALLLTTPLAIIQLLASTYLMIAGSDEKITGYATKSAEYSLLHSEFDYLANFPIKELNAYQRRFDILVEREKGVGRGNFKIKDKEKRMGMRWGLREYQRACAACKEVPTGMESTDCNVCGNFK